MTSGSSSDSASTASEDEENGETTEEKTVKCKCNTTVNSRDRGMFGQSKLFHYYKDLLWKCLLGIKLH